MVWSEVNRCTCFILGRPNTVSCVLSGSCWFLLNNCVTLVTKRYPLLSLDIFFALLGFWYEILVPSLKMKRSLGMRGSCLVWAWLNCIAEWPHPTVPPCLAMVYVLLVAEVPAVNWREIRFSTGWLSRLCC